MNDDIETIRDALKHSYDWNEPRTQKGLAALDRLEAELTRLRETIAVDGEATRKERDKAEAEVERLRVELEIAEDTGYKLGWQQAMEAEHPPEEVTPIQTDP